MSFLKKLHPCPQIPLSPLKPPASWTTCHAEDDTTQTQQGEQNESHLEGGIRIPRWGRGRQIRKRSRFVTWKHELLHLRFTCRLIIIYIHIFLAHVSAISIYIYIAIHVYTHAYWWKIEGTAGMVSSYCKTAICRLWSHLFHQKRPHRPPKPPRYHGLQLSICEDGRYFLLNLPGIFPKSDILKISTSCIFVLGAKNRLELGESRRDNPLREISSLQLLWWKVLAT